MTREDFNKIGLEHANCVGGDTIFVTNWGKFFPQINLPTEGPLVELAKKCWFTLVTHQKRHVNGCNIRIRGADALYLKSFYALDVITITKEDFLEHYCPYNADDVRRYVWFNVLSQFDYSKICNDIQEAITNIIRVKND